MEIIRCHCLTSHCTNQIEVHNEVRKVGSTDVLAIQIRGEEGLHDVPTVWLGRGQLEELRAIIEIALSSLPPK